MYSMTPALNADTVGGLHFLQEEINSTEETGFDLERHNRM